MAEKLSRANKSPVATLKNYGALEPLGQFFFRDTSINMLIRFWQSLRKMSKLEDLQPSSAVRGVLPDELVSVVNPGLLQRCAGCIPRVATLLGEYTPRANRAALFRCG